MIWSQASPWLQNCTDELLLPVNKNEAAIHFYSLQKKLKMQNDLDQSEQQSKKKKKKNQVQ